MKKLISVCLALCILCSAFCMSAFAAESGTINDSLTWELSTIGRLTIKGTGDTIPDYEETENETSTAPWGVFAGRVTSLSLPNTITAIGDYAFSGCANLKEITFPTRLAQIGKGAFKNCGFTALELPEELKEVADECFMGCEELVSVQFPDFTSGGMGVVVKDGVRSIGKNAFAFCYALERLNLPSTLETIGNSAFEDCDSLKSVSFADSGKALTDIGVCAFSYCTSLTAFTFPENITAVKADTFKGAGLKTVKLPLGITSVGKQAFAFCTSLTRMDVYAADCAFYADANTTPNTTKLYVTGSAAKTIAYAAKFSKPIEVLCVGRKAKHDSFKTTIVKASAGAAGKISRMCRSCGWTQTTIIPLIKAVKLSKTAFVYTGAKQYPSAAQVVITDAAGKRVAAANYTVTCGTAGKAVGTHWVKIAFTAGSNYQGSFVRYYTIIPKGTVITKIVGAKSAMSVQWKKAAGVGGYQIQYAKNAKFSGAKAVTVKGAAKYAQAIQRLSAGNYYVRIRTFKAIGGKYYFSTWSATKAVAVKAATTTASRTVYITKTGKRYHYDSKCGNGTYYKTTLKEALAKGLTPCQKCVHN